MSAYQVSGYSMGNHSLQRRLTSGKSPGFKNLSKSDNEVSWKLLVWKVKIYLNWSSGEFSKGGVTGTWGVSFVGVSGLSTEFEFLIIFDSDNLRLSRRFRRFLLEEIVKVASEAIGKSLSTSISFLVSLLTMCCFLTFFVQSDVWRFFFLDFSNILSFLSVMSSIIVKESLTWNSFKNCAKKLFWLDFDLDYVHSGNAVESFFSARKRKYQRNLSFSFMMQITHLFIWYSRKLISLVDLIL